LKLKLQGSSVNLTFKIGILRAGTTQRQLALDARIPEGRVSQFVRGTAWPTDAERAALNQILGADFFDHPAEVRSRR
jgi:hypothetical protein